MSTEQQSTKAAKHQIIVKLRQVEQSDSQLNNTQYHNNMLQLPIKKSRPQNSAYTPTVVSKPSPKSKKPCSAIQSSAKVIIKQHTTSGGGKQRTIQQKDQQLAAASLAATTQRILLQEMHGQQLQQQQQKKKNEHFSPDQQQKDAIIQREDFSQFEAEESGEDSRRSSLQKKRPVIKSSMLESVDRESEYNIQCSNESSPEHKIHTVVGRASFIIKEREKATASQFDCSLQNTGDHPSSRVIKLVVEQPMGESPQATSEGDFTPQTPHTYTMATSDNGQKQDDQMVETASFDISQYTNGNMNEMIEDEAEAIKKDKAEFMYGFEGAMSVIQETEEPEDEMTIKNSAMSSRMQIGRIESLPTPNERGRVEALPHKQPNKCSIVSPKIAQAIAVTQMQNSHFMGQKNCINLSVSLMEELTAGMDSLEEPQPITPMMMSNQNNAAMPKSMQNCVENATSMLKLFDLTHNNLPLQQNQHMISSPTVNSTKNQVKSYLQKQQEFLKKNIGPSDVVQDEAVEEKILIFDEQLPRTPATQRQISQFDPLIQCLDQEIIKQQGKLVQGSPLNDILDKFLSPASPRTQNSDTLLLDHQLVGLNRSIVNLKEDIKNFSVQIYKEVKVQNQRVQQTGNMLEDKLDCDFLERIMHVYAFFTSCLNLVLQNDKEAHKLLILQPMIEKHITELKQDQLIIQTGMADFFGVRDQTMSTIGGQSFDMSYASVNNTMLNQMMNGNYQAVGETSPQKGDNKCGGLTVVQKLTHLQSLLQMADQVLQLNGLKHRLIVDSKRQWQKRQSLLPEQQFIQMQPVGPLFTHQDQQAAPRNQSGPRRNKETKMTLSPRLKSPVSFKGLETTRINDQEESPDIYYHKMEQQKALRKQSAGRLSNNKPDTNSQLMITPARREKQKVNMLKSDNEKSTLESSKGETILSSQTTSPGETTQTMQYRRHRSLGNLSSPRNLPKTSQQATATTNTAQQAGAAPFVYQPHQSVANSSGLPRMSQRYSDQDSQEQQAIHVKQVADTYFSTMPSSPTTGRKNSQSAPWRSTHKRQSAEDHNNQVVRQMEQSRSFIKKQTTQGLSSQSFAERPTQDESNKTSNKQGNTNYLQNSSFGVMNSSGGSVAGASRNVHEAYHQYQQFSNQGQQLSQKPVPVVLKHQNSAETINKVASYIALSPSRNNKHSTTMKDNQECFITAMQRCGSDGSQKWEGVQQFYPAYANRSTENDSQDTTSQPNYRQQESFNKGPMLSPKRCLALGINSDKVEFENFGPIVNSPVAHAQVAYKLPDQKRKLTLLSPASRKSKQLPSARMGEKGLKIGNSKGGIESYCVNKHSLSPRNQPQDLILLQTPKSKHLAMSRNLIGGGVCNKAKTSKTVAMPQNGNESISDTDMLSLSQATIDQFEQNTVTRKRNKVTGQSSFLATMNCSASVSHIQADTTTLTKQDRKNLGLSDSKMRKALKGVISAQENNFVSSAQGKSVKGSGKSGIHNKSQNSQQQSQMGHTVKSPGRTTHQTLKRNHSAKLQNLAQVSSAAVAVQLQEGKLSQRGSVKRKMVKINSVNQLHQNQSNNNNNKQFYLTSEAVISGNAHPLNNSKKKYAVLNSSRTSNYLLKQEIGVNSDKLVGLVEANQCMMSGQHKRTATSPQKSLSEAFDAVAKAISKKQQQVSSQQHTRIITKKNSIIFQK